MADVDEGPEAACDRLDSRQHGVLARHQAIELGMTPRMIEWRVASGRWRPVHPGAYVLAGSPGTWRQAVMAAVLWGGPGSVASHRTAAVLWNLDGISAADIEITTTRNIRSPKVIVHRTTGLARADVTTIATVPVTNPTRTLIDLALKIDDVALETALDDALSRDLTRLPRLNWRIGQLSSVRYKGLRVLRDLVAARDPRQAVPESVLETRLLQLLRSTGVPEPITQYQIVENGKPIARVDFAYPHVLLAIEADGYRYHARKGRWQADLKKRSALASLGWRLIVVTWDDVTRAHRETVNRIHKALDDFSPHD
jgi:very-short-patch-repair endonuclease